MSENIKYQGNCPKCRTYYNNDKICECGESPSGIERMSQDKNFSAKSITHKEKCCLIFILAVAEKNLQSGWMNN